jgi:hypothetical protein
MFDELKSAAIAVACETPEPPSRDAERTRLGVLSALALDAWRQPQTETEPGPTATIH